MKKNQSRFFNEGNLRKDIIIILCVKVVLLIVIKIYWFSDNIDAASDIGQHFLTKMTP